MSARTERTCAKQKSDRRGQGEGEKLNTDRKVRVSFMDDHILQITLLCIHSNVLEEHRLVSRTKKTQNCLQLGRYLLILPFWLCHY